MIPCSKLCVAKTKYSESLQSQRTKEQIKTSFDFPKILCKCVSKNRISGFSFLCQDTNIPGSNLVKTMLPLFKETDQYHIKHRIEGQTSRSLNYFSLLGLELPLKQELSNTIELSSFLLHVLFNFSTEFLKTSREFSENTMKTYCCFIVSFK